MKLIIRHPRMISLKMHIYQVAKSVSISELLETCFPIFTAITATKIHRKYTQLMRKRDVVKNLESLLH